MTELSISAARGILQDADRQLRQLEVQLVEVRRANDQAVREQAGHAAEVAAHKAALNELSEKHKAECAARERELRVMQAHAAETLREGQALIRRATDHEATLANKAADLRNRYPGGLTA
jgi:hypothetical protein